MAKNQDKARELSPTRETGQKIHADLAELFGDTVRLEDAVDPYTVIEDGTQFLMVMGHLKNDPNLSFDFLRSVAGVDYPEEGKIASVYHLWSYASIPVVKFMCDREAPSTSSKNSGQPPIGWSVNLTYSESSI